MADEERRPAPNGANKDPDNKDPKDKKKPYGGNKRGRGGNNRGRGRDDRGQDRGKDEGKKDPYNDVNWYALTESIGKAAASIPFNVFAGTYIDDLTTNGQTQNQSIQTMPGVLTIRYLSVPGSSTNAQSAVNIAARALYSWVRHQNSGHANYESPDLMLYVLAMAQVYALIFEAKRAYRMAMTYVPTNRNIPDLLMTAAGCDAENIRANLAKLRYGINLRIAKISSLCVPKVFQVFLRQALLATVVLTDSSSVRSQFYIYQMAGYFKFDATGSTGGQLVETNRIATSRTVDNILAEIDDCLDVILADEDMNIMSGDILKAYGRENLYSIPELAEEEVVDFVYDEDMLNQIENSVCMYQGLGDGIDITQKDGYLLYQPSYDLGGSNTASTNASKFILAASKGYYFNSHKDEPDWKDVLEWSRNMPGFSGFVNGSTGETITVNCGSELIVDFNLVTYKYTDASTISVQTVSFGSGFTVSSASELQTLINYSKFDWAPILYVFWTSTALQGVYQYVGPNMDAKVFTRISADSVARMNDCAIMGEFRTTLIAAK